jgi:predicted HTH domain antitoxin
LSPSTSRRLSIPSRGERWLGSPRSSGSFELEELLEEWEEEDRELRELRKRRVDREYVASLPSRLRGAVELYVERGDLRLACELSGLPLDEFVEVLRRAGVWAG